MKDNDQPQEPREGRPDNPDAGNGIGHSGEAEQPGVSEVGARVEADNTSAVYETRAPADLSQLSPSVCTGGLWTVRDEGDGHLTDICQSCGKGRDAHATCPSEALIEVQITTNKYAADPAKWRQEADERGVRVIVVDAVTGRRALTINPLVQSLNEVRPANERCPEHPDGAFHWPCACGCGACPYCGQQIKIADHLRRASETPELKSCRTSSMSEHEAEDKLRREYDP